MRFAVLIVVVTLVLLSWGIRGYFSLNHLSFMHPDAIYQSVEVAHSIVFGVGKLPNEFQQPDHPPGYLAGVDNRIYGPIHSIFASRSPIFPSFFAIVMKICNFLHLDYHLYSLPLQRVAMVSISGLIPLSSFLFAFAYFDGDVVAACACAYLTAIDDFFIWTGSHTIVNSFVGPIVLTCLASIIHYTKPEHQQQPQMIHALVIFVTGMVAVISCYIRPDTVMAYALFILICIPKQSFWAMLHGKFGFFFTAGSLLGLALAGLGDRLFFGVWFITAYNWISFNVIEQLSVLSGREPSEFYIDAFFVNSPGFLCLFLGGCCGVWFAKRTDWDKTLKLLRLGATGLIMLWIFSSHPHKEERFFFIGYGFLVIFAGTGVVQWFTAWMTNDDEDEDDEDEFAKVEEKEELVAPEELKQEVEEDIAKKKKKVKFSHDDAFESRPSLGLKGKRDVGVQVQLCSCSTATTTTSTAKKLTPIVPKKTISSTKKSKKPSINLNNPTSYKILLFALILFIFISVDNFRRVQIRPWTVEEDINRAMAFIGQQSNLTGLAVAYPWFTLGMYSLVHQPVPIACLETGFNEPALPFLHKTLQDESYNYVLTHTKNLSPREAKPFFQEFERSFQIQAQIGNVTVYARDAGKKPKKPKVDSKVTSNVDGSAKSMLRYAKDQLNEAMECMFAMNKQCSEDGFLRILSMSASKEVHAEAKLGFGWLRLQLGMWNEGVNMINDAVESKLIDYERYMHLCHRSYHTGKMGRAWFYCSGVMYTGKGEAVERAAYMIGIIIWQAGGDSPQTQQWAKMQVAITSNSTQLNLIHLPSRSLSLIGIMGFTQGYMEEATMHFKDATSIEPSFSFARIHWALLQVSVAQKNGNDASFAAANKAVDILRQGAVNSFSEHVALAYVLLLAGENNAAQQQYEKAEEYRQNGRLQRLMTTQEFLRAGGAENVEYLVMDSEPGDEYYTLGFDLFPPKISSKKPRVAVVSLFDDANTIMGRIFKSSWTRYCQRHNYNLIVEEHSLDTSRPTAWSKILLLLREMQNYDWVLWADADTIVWRPQLSLDRFMTDDRADVLVEMDMHMVMNTGLILIRSSTWSRDYLQLVWQQTDQINADFWENSAMVKLWHNAPSTRERMKILPYGSLHTYPPHRTGRDFVLHFPGTDHKERKMEKMYTFAPSEDDMPMFPPVPIVAKGKKSGDSHATPKPTTTTTSTTSPPTTKSKTPSKQVKDKSKKETTSLPPPPPLSTTSSSKKKIKKLDEDEEESDIIPPIKPDNDISSSPSDYQIDSFSVVIPTHNDEDIIAATIHRLKQPFQVALSDPSIHSGEVVVVMDACVDNTRTAAQEALAAFGYPYQLLSSSSTTQSMGAGATRNVGVKYSKGKVIFFLDSDDVYLDNHILECMKALQASPNIAYIKTNVEFQDYIHPYWIGAIQNSLVLNLAVRREAFEFLEGFVEMPGAGGEDSAFNTHISQFFQGRKLDVTTSEYVRKPGGLFEKQLKKFQHGPEFELELAAEVGDKPNPAYGVMIDNRSKWLQAKLGSQKPPPHALPLFLAAMHHYGYIKQ